MAGALRAVTVSFVEHGIAVLRMQRGENRINKEFIDAFNSCLDEVERSVTQLRVRVPVGSCVVTILVGTRI